MKYCLSVCTLENPFVLLRVKSKARAIVRSRRLKTLGFVELGGAPFHPPDVANVAVIRSATAAPHHGGRRFPAFLRHIWLAGVSKNLRFSIGLNRQSTFHHTKSAGYHMHTQNENEKEVFCYEDLSSRCLGNAQLIERVLSAFTNGAEDDLAVLRDAIQDQDLMQAGKTAHRLKGAAANAGAYRISETAATLERNAKNEEVDSLNDLCVQLLTSFEEFLDATQTIFETDTPLNPQSNPQGEGSTTCES